MTTDSISQSKQLGKSKVGVASEEVAEKTSDEGNHSAGLTWKEHFFNAICLIAIGTSIATSILNDSPMVVFLGILCSFLGCTSAWLQNKIIESEQMREIHNKVKEEVAYFRKECKQLTVLNDEYEETIGKLKKAEDALKEIVEKEGKTVNDIVNQVEEMKKTQAKLEESIHSQVMQNIISIVLAVDKDENFHLSDEEAEELIVRVKSTLEVAVVNVELNDEIFRKVIMENDVSGVVDIISKNIRQTDLPEEKKILKFSKQD